MFVAHDQLRTRKRGQTTGGTSSLFNMEINFKVSTPVSVESLLERTRAIIRLSNVSNMYSNIPKNKKQKNGEANER